MLITDLSPRYPKARDSALTSHGARRRADIPGRSRRTFRSCMDSDKTICAELVQAWGFARDQGRWDDLLAIFHPGGEIAVSWFRGPYTEFVAHCQRNHD